MLLHLVTPLGYPEHTKYPGSLLSHPWLFSADLRESTCIWKCPLGLCHYSELLHGCLLNTD